MNTNAIDYKCMKIDQLLGKISLWFRRKDWWYEVKGDSNSPSIYARALLKHQEFRIQIRFDQIPGLIHILAMPEFSISEDRRSQADEFLKLVTQNWKIGKIQYSWGNGSVYCAVPVNLRNYHLRDDQIDNALSSVCHQMGFCFKGLFEVVIFRMSPKNAFTQTVSNELQSKR